MDQPAVLRYDLQVSGLVQGIGFRPFAKRLADELGVCGSVRNRSGQVEIVLYCTARSAEQFLCAIKERSPAGSRIERIESSSRDILPGEAIPDDFSIIESSSAGNEPVMVAPDIAMCADCGRELMEPGNPRFMNPFISCTACGPRFSIMRRVPYDRANTSMAGFELCPLCGAEYNEPANRRFHAQTVCCNECGPRLGADLNEAIQALKRGKIVAIKGIGGYHFACSPFIDETVRALRVLKGREHKPFAVMFPSIEALGMHAEISIDETALLTGSERPIVLLRLKPSDISRVVYGNSPDIGAFLPYTPLQHLILGKTGALVMTSANESGFPIIVDDGEMNKFCEEHDSLFSVLCHDRVIINRQDDSVIRWSAGGSQLIRRARGYVPEPLALPHNSPPFIALGAHEKSAFCLYKGGLAYLSAECGSLESIEAMTAYSSAVTSMSTLLTVEPEFAACDMHPRYASTEFAEGLDLPMIRVQHHHAHIASVMAEHALTEPVIGVAFDGTGYGLDGTVWGGEFLIVSPAGSFTREAHIDTVNYLGSDSSVRQSWKTLACVLHSAGLAMPDGAGYELIRAALIHGVNTIPSSSMGRMFDAVSAMLGICLESEYDGQSAIELEYAARAYTGHAKPLPYEWNGDRIDLMPMFRALAENKHASAAELSYRFHISIAHMILDGAQAISRRSGILNVALSGGVFLNRLLLEHTIPLLEASGFSVFTNRRYSPGDGSIALGQAHVAAAIMRRD